MQSVASQDSTSIFHALEYNMHPVPLLNFNNSVEFLLQWRKLVDNMCKILQQNILKLFIEGQLVGHRRLIWTQYELLHLGMADFSHFTRLSRELLVEFFGTSYKAYCEKILTVINFALQQQCRNIFPVPVSFSFSPCTTALSQRVEYLKLTLLQCVGYPTCLNLNDVRNLTFNVSYRRSIFNEVVSKNVTRKFHDVQLQGMYLKREFDAIVLALACSLHKRLGEASTIKDLLPELFVLILQHL